MKQPQSRYPRSYKTTDKVYKAAQRQAKKDKIKLSQQIEKWVEMYSMGYEVRAISPIPYDFN